VVPGKLTLLELLPLAAGNYAFKLVVAVAITPLIYLGHGLIDRYLAAEEAPHSSSPHTAP
jgi:uncharacterized PurR-regulated membrane protein YhhQ (DUF165 family)